MKPLLSNIRRDGKGRLSGSFEEVFDVLDNLHELTDSHFICVIRSNLDVEDIRLLLDQCYQCQCCPRHNKTGVGSQHISLLISMMTLMGILNASVCVDTFQDGWKG